jgi:hypothetical protein
MDLIYVVQDRDNWKALVNTVMNLGSHKGLICMMLRGEHLPTGLKPIP